MTDQPWWQVAEFEQVVSLAVTELYQDSIDHFVNEEGVGALHRVVAEVLRDVHFMEIRNERDELRRWALEAEAAMTEEGIGPVLPRHLGGDNRGWPENVTDQASPDDRRSSDP